MGLIVIDRWTCDRCGVMEERPAGRDRPEKWTELLIGPSFGPDGPDSYKHPVYQGMACGDCAHLIRTLWLRKDKP